MGSRRKKKPANEIYELGRSPFAQRLTKRKLAELLRVDLHTLVGLVKYKTSFVTVKTVVENGKPRPLQYPTGRLRVVNEKINYQLKKIKLPVYVMSPRKGCGQKQNAEAHIEANQILKLDLRKFYPSISRTMIARFFRDKFDMHTDVAGLLTELLTFDGTILYGAPATPVLAMLVHAEMFDRIDEVCKQHGAALTLWVDNLTISGDNVPGEALKEIREIIASYGHRSHDVEYACTNKIVQVTGIGVKQGRLHPANSGNVAIRDLEKELRQTTSPDEYEAIANRLLSRLGSQRHILGTKDARGQAIANRMNAIRQKRWKVLQS